MDVRKRFFSLIIIMGGICLILTAVSMGVLYQTALEQERARLVETAQSQARLIEAVARFDLVYSNDYPQGATAATLSQIRDAHGSYTGFGKTGEFTLACLEDKQIVFLLSHRHQDLNRPAPVNIVSPLAEPMRRALSGKAGTMIGLDYRGETVMAAYEPVGELGLGIVAKIDMAEIRAPFVRAALVVVGMMIVLVALGAGLFQRINVPILRRMEAQNSALEAEVEERKRSETSLQKREQLLEEMGSIARIGGWEHDLMTGAASWTKEIYRIVELDESDSIPGPEEHLSYYEPESRRILEEAYTNATTAGTSFDLELQGVSTSSRRIWVRTIGRPEFEGGRCVKMRGTLQDITERKKMEEMIHQSQKMESIGNLAGGVAHDYNNMLSVILGHTEMALEKVNEQDLLYQDLMQVLKAARHSSGITRQLLAFARRQTTAPKVLDLNNTVATSLKMLHRLIGEDLDLIWQPGAGLWPVKMDPTQVDQILANLCVNARDAIPDVGKVTIETANVNFDEEYCSDHPGFVPGDFVMLAVSDNGSGIAAGIRDKIFDPFFTTKGIGKGTGLGLSTIYGIVKQNHGFINVYSEPGQGTTIKVYLSRHEGDAVEVVRGDTSTTPLGRGETILLVEDDRSILKLGQRLLEDLNYTVLSAATPGDAASLAREHSREIKLLITDVVMPEMNGRDLSRQIQKICTNIRTLYMSGYTANVIAHRGVLDEGVFFLPKPFSKRELAVKVREVLNSDIS